ncbi:MAG: fibronectin type III domain-containing protein, partial [Bacteroidales bacterium]|nr:fibronectin type III domain-containing protein [Bacteroidales bacterium]
MKRFMFFLMAIIFAIEGWSQDTVQIGSGTTNGSAFIPWYATYNNTYSQQLFTAAEIIAANGGVAPTDLTMTSMAWDFIATTTRQYIHILIGSTTATTLSAWVAPTNFVEVFSSAETTFNPGWNYIGFQQPFVWDGTSNIVVTVISYYYWSSSGLPHASSCAQSSATSMSRYYYIDGTTGVPYFSTTTNPTSAGTSASYRNTTKFIFDVTPTCIQPTSVSIPSADIQAFQANVAWTTNPLSLGTEWEIQYKPDYVTSWDDPAVNTDVAYASPHTLTGLSSATTYNVRIREVCGTGSTVGTDVSLWTLPVNFTTAISCPAPTALAVPSATITTTSADVTWIDEALGQEYVIEWKLNSAAWGDDPTQTAVIYPATQTYSISGLTPNTPYNVRLRAVCDPGVDSSSWISVSFRTACAALTSADFPYYENFDTYGTGATTNFPSCWTQTYTYTSARPYISSTYTTSSPGAMYFYAGTNTTLGHYDIGVLPEIDASVPLNTLRIKFNGRSGSYANCKLVIGAMTDPTDGTTFVGIDTLTIATASTWVYDYEVPLSSYTGSGQYIALKTDANSSTYGYFYVDDLMVDFIPACSDVYGAAAISLSSSSIQVSWTDVGTDMQIVYGDAATFDTANSATYTSVTVPTGTTLPYVVNGLTAETAYKVALRHSCGGTYSTWSNVINVLTRPVMTAGVESWIGYVFNMPTQGVFGDTYYGSVTEPAIFTRDVGNGAWTGTTTNWIGSAPTDNFAVRYLMSKTVECGYYKFVLSGNTNGVDDIARFSIDGGLTWVVPGKWLSGWTGVFQDSVYLDAGTYDFVLDYGENSGTAAVAFNFYPIAMPFATTVTPYTIDVHFPDSISADWTTWEVMVSSTPLSDPYTQTGDILNTTTINNPYTITGLTDNTPYYIYARPINSCDNDTLWRSKTTTTSIACPAPTDLAVPSASITTTTANVTWTDAVPGQEYIIEWKPFAADWDGVLTSSAIVYQGTGVYPLSNLSPSMQYTVRMRAVCNYGADTSAYASVTFMTSCGAITSLPWGDNFDTYGSAALPACWGRLYTYSSARPNTSSTTAYSGSYSLYFYAGTTSGVYDIGIMPEIDASIPVNTLRLKFYGRGAYANNKFIIGVMTDPTSAATFEALDTIVITTANVWNPYEVLLDNYTGTGQYIAFKTDANSTTYGYFYMDNLVVDEIPACPDMYDFAVLAGPTTTSFDISWTEMGHDVELIYGEAATFDINNPSTYSSEFVAAGTTLPYTISGLSADQAYKIAARHTCDFDGNGNWSAVQTVATPPTEVYGTNQWIGYVYNAPTIYQPQTYMGQVTEPAQFTKASTSGVWTGSIAESWVSAAPSDRFFVRYMMTTNFTCGTYKFKLNNVDDVARLSIDGGLTWLIQPANWGGTTGQTGSFTGSITLTTGSYDLVLEYYEVTGSAALGFAYEIMPMEITVNEDNTTTNSVEIEFPVSSGSSWSVMVSSTPVSPLNQSSIGDVENSTGIVTNPYTITGLTANTTYYIYAHPESACDNDTLWGSTTAKTNCDVVLLPYTEDFEAYTGTTYNTVGIVPDCWASFGVNTSYHAPHITGSGSYWYPHSGSKVLTMTAGTTGSGTEAYVVLPAFETSIDSLRMSFWYKTENATIGSLTLGYLTGGQNNTATFTPVVPVPNTQTLTQFTYDFSTSTDATLPNATYIAFKWLVSASFYTAGIDDILVEVAPSCPDISGFAASIVDESSVNVSFTDIGEDVEIVYGDPATFDLATETWDNSVTVPTGSTLPYTLSGLSPSTSYSIAIRNACGASNGGNGIWSNVITVTTGPVEISPVDSWNGYVFASPTVYNPTTYLGMVTEATPQFTRNVTNSTWTGATATWIDGGTTGPADNFFVRYRMTTDFTCGTYLFSLTNVDDVARLSIDGGQTWLVQSANWGTSITNGTVTGSAYMTAGTYDLVIEYYEVTGGAQVGISWAIQPMVITTSNLAANSVDVEFPATSGTQWALKVASIPLTDPNTETGDVEDLIVTSNPYTITGLTGNTTYYIYAHPAGSSCDNDTLWGSKQITTYCDALSLPYVEDFEAYTGTTYSSTTGNVIPDCWANYTTNTTYRAPHITGSGSYWYPHSGSKVLTFTTGSAGADAYAVLPMFDTLIQDLMITFWYRTESATNGKLIIGYITGDQTDMSTFTGLDTCAMSYNVHTEHEYSFKTSTDANLANATFIVLRWNYNASYYSCGVDDIIVELAPDCPSIKNVTVSGITTTDANVNFNANGNTSWEYVYGDASSVTDPDNETPYPSTSNPIALTGLNPSTTYNVWIRSTCTNGSGYGNWTPITTFTTLATCLPVTALVATNVTNEEITISWTASTSGTCSGYNVEYGPVGFTQGSGTTDYVTGTSFTAQGLDAGTAYTFYVQSDCSGDLAPWVSINVTTIPDPVTLPYSQDFEDLTDVAEWQFSNLVNNHAWYIGSATGNTGNSMYISNDGGVSNAYTNNITSTYNYPYAAIYVDFGNYAYYNISFDWKCYGESAEAGSYDKMRVYAVPTSYNYSASGTALNQWPSGTGVHRVGETFSLQSSWQKASISLSAADYANTIQKILFIFFFDGSAGTQPPAAVDNISITGTNCAAPTGVIATLNSSDNQSVDVSWTAGNATDANWVIYYKKSTENNTMWVSYPTTNNPATISGLDYATTYNFYVTTDCDGLGTGNESFASSTVNYTTPALPPTVVTLAADNITQTSATLHSTITAGTQTIVTQGYKWRTGTDTWSTSTDGLLTGLTANTTYEFYAFATTASGTTNGLTLNFTTLATVPPTVVTNPATNVLQTSATLNSTITAGSETITAQGYQWRQQGTSTWSTSSNGLLTGLTANTTYEFYAYATTASGTTDGSTLNFTTLNVSVVPPTVLTEAADNITQTSATLHSTITAGNETITAQGYQWRQQGTSTWSTSSDGLLTGLTANTTYEFYAYATTASGTTDGSTLNFTTLNVSVVPPTVVTLAADNITQTSATLHSTITAGNETITAQGYQWRQQGTSTWSTSSNGLLTGLTANTTYEFYAYATTASGTTDGSILNFTTLVAPPTVVTEAATSITQTSATLNSTVTAGSETISAQGYKWRTGTDAWSTSSDGLLTGLTANTTYEFYAYATTASGTTNGLTLNFTTLAIVPPTVLTEAATSITQTSATLNSTVTAGSETIAEQGYKWRTGTDAWSTSSDGLLTGLIANTTYDFFAYATTASGTVTGDTLNFTTLVANYDPEVVTDTAIVNPSNECMYALNGHFVLVGNPATTEAGFVVAMTANPEVGGAGVETPSATVNFFDGGIISAVMTVSESGVYHYRTYAKKADNTYVYGNDRTFDATACNNSLADVSADGVTVTIYPNPATHTATLNVEGLKDDAQVTITDLTGKV